MQRLLLIFLLITSFAGNAQKLTVPPDGGNKKATVTERIGITDVTLHYDRPGVKGREGKIWGQLVPYGFTDLGFGISKQAPWRAGANENTTISFSTDVMVGKQPVAAGTYGLFIAMGEQQATLILSKYATAWGSFFYDPKDDALRLTVPVLKMKDEVERLRYEFMDQTDSSAVIAMEWEFVRIPFEVSVNLSATQMASFRKQLHSDVGFQWEAWADAAKFAVAHHTNLDEALTWSDYAISGPFVGQKNFRTLSTKASVLAALNRQPEADQFMKEAMPLATMEELHQYGRQLLRNKRNKEALEVFELNEKNHPGKFTPLMGLTRAYSANGEYAKAAVTARKALVLAPDKANKDAVTRFITMLDSGKDINQ